MTNIGASNGLLRQYFPKATDLSIYPVDYLDTKATNVSVEARVTFAHNMSFREATLVRWNPRNACTARAQYER